MNVSSNLRKIQDQCTRHHIKMNPKRSNSRKTELERCGSLKPLPQLKPSTRWQEYFHENRTAHADSVLATQNVKQSQRPITILLYVWTSVSICWDTRQFASHGTQIDAPVKYKLLKKGNGKPRFRHIRPYVGFFLCQSNWRAHQAHFSVWWMSFRSQFNDNMP